MDISSLENLTPTQKDDLKKQLKAQLAAANFEELVNEISEKCFAKCVTKPASSLDSYEQRCLSNCMDRFLDSYNTVARAYTARVAKETGQQ
ncbi:Mitochondrial import inner membrane translocase subunit Tim13, partial [Fragariocoptes setiger]